MNQPTGFELEAGAIARLLAGAPPGDAEMAALPEPWTSLAQAIAGACGDQRLAAFDGSLSGLPESQAADIRNQVGKAGRAILQGTAPAAPRPEIGSADLLDLPQEAQIPPAIQEAGQEVGHWLSDFVAFAGDVSERTPHLFHEAIGLWIGGLAIARRLRLRLRHGDLYPNLYVLGVADTTLYAKSTGLEVGSRLIHDCFPQLLFANDFTPEAMLSDLAGREPANLHAADLTERDRELWLAGRNFSAQRGVILEEMSALLAGLRRDYMTGMAELLLRLYDCPDLYRRNTRGAGFVVVRNAYLSLLGMTTPARLRGAEIHTAWHDGLFARFGLLTPEAPPARPGDDFERSRPPYPPHLLADLTHLANARLPIQKFPDPVLARDVEMSDDAKAAWWQYFVALTHTLLTSDNPPAHQLWGNYARLPAQALKIALILAALDWGCGHQQEPRLTLPHYARAQGIAERWRASAHRLLDMLSNREVAAEFGKEDRILQLVRGAGPKGIAARDLYRTLKLRRTDFDDLVAGLSRDGLIQSIQIESARGPAATGFVATEYLSRIGTGRQVDR
jgi:hypothetical protein